MGDDARRAALAAIEAAFADVARPADDELLHPRCLDDGDIQGLSGVARWQDLDDATIEREYAALSFLSAAGFRHFLPAYLRWVLTHEDHGEAVIGATLAALDPDRYGDDLAAFQRSKYVSLTEEQRAAIAAFVRAMAGHDEIGGAAAEWPPGP
jgi:hypothetical protein